MDETMAPPDALIPPVVGIPPDATVPPPGTVVPPVAFPPGAEVPDPPDVLQAANQQIMAIRTVPLRLTSELDMVRSIRRSFAP
jgi:hypothetical protein